MIKEAKEIYDIIILDFPDPNRIEISKLYSLSFYKNLKQHLSSNGIIVQQSSSPFFMKETFLLIGRTMKKAGLSVLAYHENVPTFGEWGWWIAGKKETISQTTLKERLNSVKEISVPTKYLTTILMKNAFSFWKNALKTSKKEKKTYNTILNNLAFKYYNQELKALQ